MIALVSFSFTTVIGFTFLVAACFLEHKFQPLIISVFYVVSPIPYFICKRGEIGFEGSSSDWFYFVTTGIVVSIFALPTVWMRSALIRFSTFVSIFIANCVSLSSIYGFIRFVLKDDDSMDF